MIVRNEKWKVFLCDNCWQPSIAVPLDDPENGLPINEEGKFWVRGGGAIELSTPNGRQLMEMPYLHFCREGCAQAYYDAKQATFQHYGQANTAQGML